MSSASSPRKKNFHGQFIDKKIREPKEPETASVPIILVGYFLTLPYMLLTWRFLPTIASLEYAQIYAFSFLSSSELARHWAFKSQSTGLQALFALNLCFRRFDWHECSAEERALITREGKKCRQISSFVLVQLPAQGKARDFTGFPSVLLR